MDRTLPLDALYVVRQSDVLSGVLRTIQHHSDAEPARQNVATLLRDRPPSDSIEDYVVRGAMCRIVGIPLDEPTIEPPLPLEQHVAETIGLAWLHRSNRPLDQLLMLDSRRSIGQNIHHHTLMLWLTAIQLHPDTLDDHPLDDEASLNLSAKEWKRAIELAVTFGLEATDMIRWTFAASMMPKAPQPA